MAASQRRSREQCRAIPPCRGLAAGPCKCPKQRALKCALGGIRGTEGIVTLEVQERTFVDGEGIGTETLAFFELRYLPDTNEVVLIKREDNEDLLFDGEAVYSELLG